jgi:hypothetical protein
MAEYGIVTKRPDKQWILATKSGIKAEDANLLPLLDEISKKGWDVVAIGDLGGGTNNEILVRK